MTIHALAYGQQTKYHLRDFSPKYSMDTFTLDGDPSFLIRRVIAFQRTGSIKSAFWDEDSHILTVQYDNKVICLAQIKDWFHCRKHPLQNDMFNRESLDNLPIYYNPFAYFSKQKN